MTETQFWSGYAKVWTWIQLGYRTKFDHKRAIQTQKSSNMAESGQNALRLELSQTFEVSHCCWHTTPLGFSY